HSVAAGKRKLSKLILLETLFSSLTAGVLAIPLGLLLTKMIETTFDSTGMMIIVQYDILMIVAFIIVLTAVLMLAAIKPIMSLRRMNTAAELKYE
ncbi:MAG: FtsX-like permease family protein, partial [Ruminococcus sp.]|nr:FtsX-like permease family protein [Ruminococcus sp.]